MATKKLSSKSEDWDIESVISSGDINENNEQRKGCYLNEPEYTNEELAKLHLNEEGEISDVFTDSKMDSSRLENLNWCSYGICVLRKNNLKLEKCKCLKETKSLLNEKLEGIKKKIYKK